MNVGRRKIRGDLRADPLGTVLAILLLALGTASFVTFTGSAAMVRADYHEQYAAGRQPDLIVGASGAISPETRAAIEAMLQVAATEPRLTVAGWLTGPSGQRHPFELLAVDDLDAWELGRSEVADGTSRPGAGEILVDRSAAASLGLGIGDRATLALDDGREARVEIVGFSRQPGRAAWFEPPAFGVTTIDALMATGLGGGPNELAIRLADTYRIVGPPFNDPVLVGIAELLTASGVSMAGVQVAPHAGETSLDRTLDGIDLVLGTLGMLALASGTLLVAGTVTRLLTRQRRQLGILQALGAERGQLTRLYAGMVAAHVVPGLAVGLVVGLGGAIVLARFVTDLINVELRSLVPGAGVIGLQVAIGLAVPSLILLVVTWRAVGAPAVANLRDTPPRTHRSWAITLLELRARTVVALIGRRNALRDGASSILIVAALAVGGGLLLAVISVGSGIEAMPDVEPEDVVGYRILAWLMGGIGAVIGAMGAIGLFASIVARATERRRELGVLAAIGASPVRLSRVVLDEAVALSVVGWLGALAAWPLVAHPLGRQLGETLTGISIAPRFGIEGLGLLLLLVAVALGASSIPALAALRLRVRDALAHE